MKTLTKAALFVSILFSLVAKEAFQPIRASKTIVQITFRDPDDDANTIIRSAYFQGKTIPLRNRSPNRFRAEIHKKLPAGTYEIRWVVETDISTFSEIKEIRKTFIIRPQDVWVDILIEGENMTLL